MQIDPLVTAERVRESYLRYLRTIYPFQDDRLRREFDSALREPEFLTKGPLLEIAAPYLPGANIRELIKAGILTSRFVDVAGDDMPLDRPLYAHQEVAIRKIAAGRNVVIASGTGSGKTEAFLIPILDTLLTEEAAGTLGTPGVRALLLYPMNALANDQLKRLRRLLVNTPQITFGRYTGETPQRPAEARERFRRNFPFEPRLENELLSREEMQAAPPHLLLTNYAML